MIQQTTLARQSIADLPKKSLAALMAVLLAICMVPLAACSTNTAEAEEGVSLPYRTDGDYTVTLPTSYGDYKGITADQVSVTYFVLDEAGYQKALVESEASESANANADAASPDQNTAESTSETQGESTAPNDASEDEASEGGSVDDPLLAEYASEQNAEVLDFTVNNDGTATLHFLDSATGTEFTPTYGVEFADKDFGVPLIVNFKTYTLTPDVSSIPSTSSTNKITLTLDDSQFVSDISADDILLYGGFEGMTIESLSSAGKNLTMQLTGAPYYNERSAAYLDGFIAVRASGIENASEDTIISIPVDTQATYFNVADLAIDGDAVTIPLTLIDITDLSTLTPEQITFNATAGATATGLTVSSLKQDSENQVTLTITGADTSSKNAAARSLMYQDVTIGDFTFSSNVVDASFYPVFDYVDEQGEDFAITLELYASSGTFPESLQSSMVTLGEGFADGTVNAFKRTGDETAELEITVPANGQTTDDLNINGEITLAAGALVNAWGEPSSDPVSYLREYTQESLGRDELIDEDSIEEFDRVVTIINNFGSAAGVNWKDLVFNIANGASGVYSMLQALELVPSPGSEALEAIRELQKSVEKLQTSLDYQTNILENIQTELYNSRQAAFDTELSNQLTDCEYLDTYFRKAETHVQPPAETNPNAEVATTPESEPTAPVETVPSNVQSGSDESVEPSPSGSASFSAAGESGAEQGDITLSSDSESASNNEATAEEEMTRAINVTDLPTEGFDYSKQPKDWSEYNAMVVSYMISHQNDPEFIGFRERFTKLQDRYDSLATQLGKTGQNNPVAVFDTLCSLSFNFDTEAYKGRKGMRTLSDYALKQALGYIVLVYNNEAQCNPARNLYQKAKQAIDSIPVGAKPGDSVMYYYTLGVRISNYLNSTYTNNFALYNAGGSYLGRMMYSEAPDDSHAVAAGHMSDEQVNSFVRRMGGRTIDEELKRAGIEREKTWWTSSGPELTIGVGLNSYVISKRPTGIKKIFTDEEDQFYTTGIKWGEKTLTKDTLTYMWELNPLRDTGKLGARITQGPKFAYFVPDYSSN